MSRVDGTSDPRAISPEKRLTGADAVAQNTPTQADTRPRQREATPAPPEAVMFVGNLIGLTPKSMTVSKVRNGPGHEAETKSVDFRRASGFEDAARTAVFRLGFPQAANADIVFVDSNSDFLRKLRRIGKRQAIYLGHALGPDGIEPAGLWTTEIKYPAIAAALAKGAPPPIIVGCFGAEVSNTVRINGLRAFLRWRDTDAEVVGGAMHKRALRAADIKINGIVLETEGKTFAPPAELREHLPSAPP